MSVCLTGVSCCWMTVHTVSHLDVPGGLLTTLTHKGYRRRDITERDNWRQLQVELSVFHGFLTISPHPALVARSSGSRRLVGEARRPDASPTRSLLLVFLLPLRRSVWGRWLCSEVSALLLDSQMSPKTERKEVGERRCGVRSILKVVKHQQQGCNKVLQQIIKWNSDQSSQKKLFVAPCPFCTTLQAPDASLEWATSTQLTSCSACCPPAEGTEANKAEKIDWETASICGLSNFHLNTLQ